MTSSPLPVTDGKTVLEFYDQHFAPERLKDRPKWALTSYARSLARFRVFLEREPLLSDLTAETCNRYEAWLLANGFAAKTGTNGYRCIVAIWRLAYHLNMVEIGPVVSRRGPRQSGAFLSDPGVAKPAILIDFVRRYAIERGLSEPSAQQLRFVLNSFGKSLGRRPRLSDLVDEKVNAWVVQMQENGLAPETVRGHRIALVGIWREAVYAELVDRPPGRIRKVRIPQRLPTAWSQADLMRLLEAAGKTPGRFLFSGVRKAPFWRAWILVGYYSGLRRDDLLRLRFDDLRPDGKLFLVQHKTGTVVRCHLPPDAMEAIRATVPPKRRRLFGDGLSSDRISKEFRVIIKAAKLKGSTKRLRATGATWCEVETPGSAMAFLGHRTPGLAYRHYVDPRFLEDAKARPPRIGGPK
jgi:integrase